MTPECRPRRRALPHENNKEDEEAKEEENELGEEEEEPKGKAVLEDGDIEEEEEDVKLLEEDREGVLLEEKEEQKPVVLDVKEEEEEEEEEEEGVNSKEEEEENEEEEEEHVVSTRSNEVAYGSSSGLSSRLHCSSSGLRQGVPTRPSRHYMHAPPTRVASRPRDCYSSQYHDSQCYYCAQYHLHDSTTPNLHSPVQYSQSPLDPNAPLFRSSLSQAPPNYPLPPPSPPPLLPKPAVQLYLQENTFQQPCHNINALYDGSRSPLSYSSGPYNTHNPTRSGYGGGRDLVDSCLHSNSSLHQTYPPSSARSSPAPTIYTSLYSPSTDPICPRYRAHAGLPEAPCNLHDPNSTVQTPGSKRKRLL